MRWGADFFFLERGISVITGKCLEIVYIWVLAEVHIRFDLAEVSIEVFGV